MAQADWAYLAGVLDSTTEVDSGPTAGTDKPAGGENFVFGFNSLKVIEGAVALAATQVNFAPTLKGGRITAAMKRGISGGRKGFAPMIFFCLQDADVGAVGYLLGLSDGDPYHISLRKGVLSEGLPDDGADPANGNHVLMRSTATFDPDVWIHLRMDVIVQGTGDVIIQVFQNDLDSNDVDAPVWVPVPGMEGPQSPAIDGFVDDALGINTGSEPLTGGRCGYGFAVSDVARRAFIDYVTIARQL